MYEVVFTNFRTHMDLVGKVSASALVPLIMETIKDGKLALTELRELQPDDRTESRKA
jgi:hypothetical protein